jgi:WD40 repeat protein
VAFLHNLTWLATASCNSTVKIWDASSGACLSTINVGTSLWYLSFDSTGTFIYTERGTITISTSHIIDYVDVTASKLQCQGAGLSPDSIWVMRSGSNILWIPSNYRPSCLAVSGTYVGMGVGSGKVWLCQVT